MAYTNWLSDHVDTVDWQSATVRFSFFVRSSGFLSGVYEGNDYMISLSETVEDLLAQPGWQAAAIRTVTGSTSSETVDGVTTITLNEMVDVVAFPTYVAAVSMSLVGTYDGVTDPLIAVYRPDEPILFGGSAARPAHILQNHTESLQWLFTVTSGEVSLSNIEVAVPVIGWESAHAVHLWMDPARTNYVANPSFESLGNGGRLFGWRTNATLSRTGSAGQRVGSLTGGSGTRIIESNVFPAANERGFWSVQAKVAGPGTYRIGILYWLPGMDPADCFFLSTTHVSESDGFNTVKAMFLAPEEAWVGQFRLEYTPPSDVPFTACRVDDVLVEPNEAQDDYFDGSTLLGQPGDTNWYGHDALLPIEVEHRSFSTFYPDRVKSTQYLFRSPTEGAAHNYVPETNQIIPHWDDVYYFRIRSWTQKVRIPVVDFPTLGKDTVVALSD